MPKEKFHYTKKKNEDDGKVRGEGVKQRDFVRLEMIRQGRRGKNVMPDKRKDEKKNRRENKAGRYGRYE